MEGGIKFLVSEKLLDEKAILVSIFLLIICREGEHSTSVDLYLRVQNSILHIYYLFL